MMCRSIFLCLIFYLFPQVSLAQICTASATAPVFGNYRAAGSDTAANGSVSVSCLVEGISAKSVFYSVKLALSTQSQGTSRRMLSAGNYLHYNVYCDGGLQNIWADGDSSTCVNTGGQANFLGTLLTVFPIYGNIKSGQFVASGSYTDTIAIQVLY